MDNIRRIIPGIYNISNIPIYLWHVNPTTFWYGDSFDVGKRGVQKTLLWLQAPPKQHPPIMPESCLRRMLGILYNGTFLTLGACARGIITVLTPCVCVSFSSSTKRLFGILNMAIGFTLDLQDFQLNGFRWEGFFREIWPFSLLFNSRRPFWRYCSVLTTLYRLRRPVCSIIIDLLKICHRH